LNPAAEIQSGTRRDKQKVPYSPKQLQTIFATAEKKRVEALGSAKANAQRLYALALFSYALVACGSEMQ
jgi:hypothetical protein